MGDMRAVPLLEALNADVQARAAELTDAADRERLIQAPPAFRDISAAKRRSGEAGTAAGAGCGNGATARLLGHRQSKGAATDKPDLLPPRHISTLPGC